MKQVLIVNVTRMGDLVQTVPLIHRLHDEWPDAAVDLLVDRSFATVAHMLPGVRHVHAEDFQALTDEARVMAKDVVALHRGLEQWARPLREIQYDRVVNLTFNRRSGLLTAYINGADTRGVSAARDGTTIVRNPWMAYFADLHRYRRFNRFNLVDLYALGGSGHGPFAALTLKSDRDSHEWAGRFLRTEGAVGSTMAVQVGASETIKAWRPEYFGRTLAAISRRTDVAFVLIGTTTEMAAVEDAKAAYRAAGGTGRVIDAVGHTTLPQLLGLLAQCRLLLTNDTGPMHLAVGAGIPVVNLSVGHVDFRETGPYGDGHWVVQPDLGCAPCGFDSICPHHACKDRLVSEQIAALCLHVLGVGPVPLHWSGARVYRSTVDADGLGGYVRRAGATDPSTEWYGEFWRRFWFEAFTGRDSAIDPALPFPALDMDDHRLGVLERLAQDMVGEAEALVGLVGQRPLAMAALRVRQERLARWRQEVIELTRDSASCEPITVALLRDLHNGESMDLVAMGEHQVAAYRTYRNRLRTVIDRLRPAAGDERRTGRASRLAVIPVKM